MGVWNDRLYGICLCTGIYIDTNLITFNKKWVKLFESELGLNKKNSMGIRFRFYYRYL